MFNTINWTPKWFLKYLRSYTFGEFLNNFCVKYYRKTRQFSNSSISQLYDETLFWHFRKIPSQLIHNTGAALIKNPIPTVVQGARKTNWYFFSPEAFTSTSTFDLVPKLPLEPNRAPVKMSSNGRNAGDCTRSDAVPVIYRPTVDCPPDLSPTLNEIFSRRPTFYSAAFNPEEPAIIGSPLGSCWD